MVGYEYLMPYPHTSTQYIGYGNKNAYYRLISANFEKTFLALELILIPLAIFELM